MAEIRLDNYPSNSDKSREQLKMQEQKKKELIPLEGVNVTKKKTSAGKKFMETIITDSIEDVKTYVIFDVMIPRVKDTILDMVNQGLNMLFKGDPRSTTKKSSNGGYNPRVSYQSYYDEPKYGRNTRQGGYHTYDIGELIVDDRGQAERILDRMFDILENYPAVTVGDLYEIVGLTTTPSDFNYGWTDLSNSGVKRVGAGYKLDLPRAKVIQ